MPDDISNIFLETVYRKKYGDRAGFMLKFHRTEHDRDLAKFFTAACSLVSYPFTYYNLHYFYIHPHAIYLKHAGLFGWEMFFILAGVTNWFTWWVKRREYDTLSVQDVMDS